MNAHGVGEVALAGATSNLFAMLADSYRRSKSIKPGDEIIIHDSSHEVTFPPRSFDCAAAVLSRVESTLMTVLPLLFCNSHSYSQLALLKGGTTPRTV